MSFSFGSPSTPANSSTNFSFGNKSGGLFGTPVTSAPAFGAATPAFGSTAPSFGAATPAFGSTAPSFGAATGTPAFSSTTGTPGFGAISGLGTSTTSVAPTFGLGTNTFGTGSTLGTGGGLNFGGTSTGTTATSAAAGSLSGLGGFSFGGATTSANTGLNLGTSTSAAPTGLFVPEMLPLSSTPERIPQIPLTQTFQMPASPVPYYQSPIPHPNLSNLRQDYKLLVPTMDTYKVMMPSIGLSSSAVSGTQATSTVTPSLGLGGTAPTGVTSASANGKGSDQPKQTKLPNEITTTVDSFKEFVKKQKGLSSEVMRFSIKPLHKVSKEAEERLGSVARLGSAVARGRVHAGKLRQQAASALAAAELAAREPLGCEAESAGPPDYVRALLGEMEAQAAAYRARLDALHAQLNAPDHAHAHLTHHEISLGMRRMHEALVAVAGRLGAAHAQLHALHELYARHVRDKRESGLGLDNAVAAKQSKSDQSFGSAVLADPRAALSSSMSAAAGPTPFSYLGNTLSPFSQNCTGGSWQPAAAPQMCAAGAGAGAGVGAGMPAAACPPGAGGLQLQLQRPPGKRNKQ